MEKVEKIILQVAQQNGIKLDISKKDTDLKSFNIDSLAAMNFIIKIEEKLGTQLKDDVLMNIKTLADLINAFNDALGV